MKVSTQKRLNDDYRDSLTTKSTNDPRHIGEALSSLGTILIRYGLVVVLSWIGAMKFTSYEANGIQPLVANSPLMSWVYQILSVQGFSNSLGLVELAIAVMIGFRQLAPKVSAVGSALAMLMFLTTMSFIFSTPGWEPSLGGFPALAVVPGQFLLKDIVLFGGAVWCLGESLAAVPQEPRLKWNRMPKGF